jgi:DNA-binding transcriptional LysR family regulator
LRHPHRRAERFEPGVGAPGRQPPGGGRQPGLPGPQRHPAHPDDLARHDCLSLDPQRGWVFSDPDTPGQTRTIKVSGRFECNDGTVLHDWAVGGIGLAWRSMWEVEQDLASGALVSVLDRYAAPPTGIYAVFPQNRRLPLRVRLLIDYLRGLFGRPDYWRGA